MIRKNKQSVSVWFFVATVLACFIVWSTIQNNREIDERRLKEPIQAVGVLISARCAEIAHAGSQSHVAWLAYQYSTQDFNQTKYILNTKHSFDTSKDCDQFEKLNDEKLNTNVVTLWYEKSQPAKASLYEVEPYSWDSLYVLVLAALFMVIGVYDQKSINQEKRNSQKLKRAANRVNRKQK